jgi:glycosyltransferase involved in cell wall biosynthesis
MSPIHVLVDSFADAGLPNAQMGNAREIVCRMDPDRFHVSMFAMSEPDPRIAARPNTRLIQLAAHRQTPWIFRELLWGAHSVLFYMKSSPASQWYCNLRDKWHDRRTTIGTIESQSDLQNEPSVNPEARHLWEQTILRCDRLYSNSRSAQQSLKREYGLPSEIIPTGVDTIFFTPDYARPQNERPRVLFVGSLRSYKQPQVVLDAAAHFPAADFRIAGEGPLGPQLAQCIADEGLRNVSLLGLLSAERLRQEYRQADIFLFPSYWEGSPKVILEAAASGLPVIVRSDYSPDTVIHGSTGFLASDNSAILDHLRCLLENPELRRDLGSNGRRLSEKYDWGIITTQWTNVFEQASRNHQGRKAS